MALAPVPAVAIVQEAPQETLQHMAERIAIEYKIASSTLFNLVGSESNWDPSTTSPDGQDRGLVQINRPANPTISDEQAFDPEFSLRFAASKLAIGDEWRWTVCSCVRYARVLGVQIPIGTSAWDLLPNTSPAVGKLVLINGNHVAVISKITEAGFWIKEANYTACKTGTRFIKWNDKSIRGFWSA